MEILKVVLSLISLHTACVRGDEILTKSIDNSHTFQLQCTPHGNPFFGRVANWYRYDTVQEKYVHVIHTAQHWLVVYTSTFSGEDLKNRTQTSISYSKHTITVFKRPGQGETTWQCCRDGDDCHNVLVSGSNPTDTTVTFPSFTVDMEPDETRFENGNLTLSAEQESVREDQCISLNCTIDASINQSKWLVIWFQNDQPILATFQNDSRVVNDNYAEYFQNVLNGNLTFDLLPVIVDPALIDVKTTTTKYEHLITFTSMVGTSTWHCGNPYIRDMSASLNITVIALPQTTNGNYETTETGSGGVPEDARVSSQSGMDSRQVTAIIAGSVCGVILIGAIVAMVLIMLRRKKKSGNETAVRNKDDLVTAENVLYIAGPDLDESQIIDKNDYADRVIQENDLYISADSEEI